MGVFVNGQTVIFRGWAATGDPGQRLGTGQRLGILSVIGYPGQRLENVAILGRVKRFVKRLNS